MTMTRDMAIGIARRCAAARSPGSVAESFSPHDWVIDAIMEVADGLQAQIDEWKAAATDRDQGNASDVREAYLFAVELSGHINSMKEAIKSLESAADAAKRLRPLIGGG